MEDEQYVAIYGYLEYVIYPAGLTKLKILFVLHIEVAKIASFLKASCFTNMLANNIMFKLFH